MRIAIPVAQGRLATHFGHCEEFALIDVADGEDGRVVSTELSEAPPHQPGLLPRWLREQGADLIIAGGMGRRAQMLFAESGIEVVTGAPSGEPESVAAEYLRGSLETGENLCDH